MGRRVEVVEAVVRRGGGLLEGAVVARMGDAASVEGPDDDGAEGHVGGDAEVDAEASTGGQLAAGFRVAVRDEAAELVCMLEGRLF